MDAAVAPRDGRAGFSLIEMLVVVAVLSVLAVGASLAVTRGGDRDSARADLTQFRDTYQTAQRLAVQGGVWRGLTPGPKGLTTQIRMAAGWQEVTRLRRWQGQMRFAPAQQGAGPQQAGVPPILIAPDGHGSAFTITFSGAVRTPTRRCISDGWTGVQCETD